MAKHAKKQKSNSEEEVSDWEDYKQSQNWAEKRNFYIFGDIMDNFSSDIIVPFMHKVKELEKRKNPKPLNIYVSSFGGWLHHAFDFITQIEYAKAKGIIVNTYVTSMACSCGSLIAVVGSNRYVGERAYHLLHFQRNTSYAISPEMTKRNTENEMFWYGQLANIYTKYTKIKNIEKKMATDNFMVNGADALIKVGLADFKI